MCSMISAQCDRLRERTATLRQGRWSDGEDDATLMERAADTILELRDDLQRANAATQEAEHDESMAWDRVRKAEAENAKLRKLIGQWYPHMRKRVGNDALRQWGHMDIMRELKIEVDE